MKTYVPAANSGVNSYTYNPTQTNKINQYIGRFDFSPTQKNQFYFVVIYEHTDQTRTRPFTGATIPGFGYLRTVASHQFSAEETRAITAPPANDLEAHYTPF